ncbi:MAG: hypothetical protein SNJ64_03275 [Endomicrobiia bacterium]
MIDINFKNINSEKSVNLDFMLDCILIKKFNILPKFLKDKSLEEFYLLQKKMLLTMAGYALEVDDIRNLLEYDREVIKIDMMKDEELFHPEMLKSLKNDYKDNKEGYEKALKIRAKLIREERKKELARNIFQLDKKGFRNARS